MDNIYEFVFRGLLTEEALDRNGRKTIRTASISDIEMAETLSIPFLDDEFVSDAKKMSVVFIAVASFENSVRDLVSGIMLESKGEGWWDSVAKGIKEPALKRMKAEENVKWHAQRGQNPINYTTLANLVAIMRHDWETFEPHIHNLEWASNVFDAIERSRNVIMHSGTLDKEDIERLGIYIRDWIKQVGT
ncbi:MAG: hypothetical protein C0603_04135 [Denitrovibrio sp.]|nr:MAG: hypothetical protein C0603_04135 [Denitrovibrio sp.]